MGNQTHWGRVLGWAAYLACSWTWCIGMFLPVLLVRDYGVWGFVVFAVPNCLGAAASGIAMRPAIEGWFLRSHGWAAQWFSLVTIGFQMFFAGWLLTWFPITWTLPGALGWLAMVLALRFRPHPGTLVTIAVAVMAATVAALVLGLASGEAQFPRYVLPFDERLVSLAPVCAFGFTLCPYLDVTFWRARREVPGSRGAAAFAIGFLGLFPIGILFTLAYSARLGDAEEFNDLRVAGSLATFLLGAHLCLQLGATSLYHGIEAQSLGREIDGRGPSPARRTTGKLVFMVAPLLLGLAGSRAPMYHGISFNEAVYRGFMGFYGLVFPAYVWLCLMPTWRDRSRPRVRALRVWLVACTIAIPMFWLGFIERHEVWLLPGLAVVILARLLIPRGTVTPDGGSEEPPEPSGAPVPVHSGPPTLGARAIPGREPPEYPGSP